MKGKLLIPFFLTIIITSAFISLSKTEAHINIESSNITESSSVEETEVNNERTEEERLNYIKELIEEKRYLKWRVSGLDLKKDIDAESFTVVNLTKDNYVLLKRDSNKKNPIASITKLLSSVIASEYLNREEIITLTQPMLRSHGYSPSLFPGAQVRVEDLMKASLIQSTNDASESLTYFMDSGMFVRLMNIKAHQIGMKRSSFFDAHGLSPENVSTPNEIVKLLEYIKKKHPEILDITREKDFQLPNIYGMPLTFRNLNILDNVPVNNFIGGKTGYLPEAKQTYTSLFKINDDIFAVVILRSENRRSDAEKIYKWLEKNPKLK